MTSIAACEYTCQIRWFGKTGSLLAVPGPQASDRRSVRFSAMGDVSSLIDQMSEAGGFTATKLAFARDILRDSISKVGPDGVLNWMSFPACLCACLPS